MHYYAALRNSLGDQGWKALSVGYCFFSFLDNMTMNNGQPFWGEIVSEAMQLMDSDWITAHAPGQHVWLSQGSWPGSKCSKSAQVRCSLLRVETRSARDCYWRNSRKTYYRECSNIKAWVSVHWQAQCQCQCATQNGPCAAESFSTQHSWPAGIEPMSPYSLLLALTTKP